MRNLVKEKIKSLNKNYYFWSFIIGALVYYLFLAYSQMAGGKYIVLMSDAIEGYVPWVRWFVENIFNGESLSYSWSSNLGINNYINIMMLFNVAMPVYLLFHMFDYATITVIVLILKAGLTSLCFFIFIKGIFKNNDISSLFFSIMYALCGFQVVYIPVLLQFSDAIFMLPLILYLVSKYADEGKFRFMIIAYLYTFLNFYYSAYIIGFFSLLYLILYMVLIKRYEIRTIIKKLVLFGLIIIVSAGVTAIILYPTAYFLMTKYAEDATRLEGNLGVFLHDVYNQFFIGQNRGIVNSYPYLYCGLPSLLLMPFYFFNNKLSKGERTTFLCLLLIMVISCLFKTPYLFWHCFDAPDSFFYRFSFIISFIVCVIACRQFEFVVDINKWKLLALIIFDSMFYYVCMHIQPKLQFSYSYYPEGNNLYLIINVIFMLLYFVFMVVYRKSKNNRKEITILFGMVVCMELIINGHSAYFKSEGYNPTNFSDSYILWEKSSKEIIADIRNENNGFYRIDSLNDYILNGATYYNYKGVTSFSNIENYAVRKTMGKLGLLTSTRVFLSTGLTDFTRMILGVAYTIDNIDFGNHKEYVYDYNQHAIAYRNPTYLSLGFLIDSGIKNFEFAGTNQFENINDLASAMTGKQIEIYDLYEKNCEYEDLGIKIVKDEDGTRRYILNPLDGNQNGLLIISIPMDEREACVQFDYGVSKLDYNAPYIVDLVSGDLSRDERISTAYIKPMTIIDDKYAIGVLMTDNIYNNVFAPHNIFFAYYNRDSFIKVYDMLKEGQMDIIDYGNGWVDAHIDVNYDNKVLFTSIPYDEGWEIKVNGVKTEPLKLLDGAFIGLELPKGSYDIEFRYYVPGLKTGCLITLISLLLMIGLLLINPQIKTEVRPERNHNKSKESKGNNEEFKDVNDSQEISNSK